MKAALIVICEIAIQLKCFHCFSDKVLKIGSPSNGKKASGRQNFLCKDCGKQSPGDRLHKT
ncbi:IS1/IS1595 family N-terminal zinc-binding domain-containing protein [Catalinimonas locisalis]|uniref:IS1/IS1595 family N-terminal zinc-binding domain-containing protein n=1 Tax=Catalinimonas locisalis TaxID=3133978 RepID=UPI00403F1F8C